MPPQSTDVVGLDRLTPPQMACWLRETARITRAAGQSPPTAKEMRTAAHVAFRLEQAAELLDRISRGDFGEFICAKCYLRQDGERPNVEF